MNRFLFFLIFFISQGFYLSQSSKGFHIPDSLKSKKFEQLRNKFESSFKSNNGYAELYANSLIVKSKTERNNLELIKAYLLLYKLDRNQPPTSIYLDSMIFVAKETHDLDYLSKGYTYKGNSYYLKGEYSKSLDNYLIAKDYSKNNLKNYNTINFNIGLLKLELENYKEAIKLFLGYKEFLEEKQLTNDTNYESCLYALAYGYNKTKQIHISNEYLRLGFQKNKISNDRNIYANLLLIQGINEYYSHNFKISLQILEKVSHLIEKISSENQNLALSDYYSGKILMQFNKPEFVEKFESVDAILLKTKDISQELRDVYPILIDYYKKQKNKDKQLYYIERLLAVDSLLYKKSSRLSFDINQKYDTPLLLKEKENLISDLNTKNYILYWVLFAACVTLFILSFLYLKNRKKINLYKNKANELSHPVTSQEVNINENISNITQIKEEKPKIVLSDDKLKLLSLKLNEFEIKKGFLDKNVSLDILAKEFQTNRAYLSKSVNELKGKNFSQYLNELRINFIIHELRINDKLQKYTIASIADHAGFNNSESFTNAFRKITGTLPSYFIKAIQENDAK